MKAFHPFFKFQIIAALVFFLIHSESGIGQPSPVPSSENIAVLRRIALLRDSLTRVRMMSFENITLANQLKTAGIIEELLNRAEGKIFNILPAGRFEWSWAGFDPPAGMVEQASGFLNMLYKGADPFEGKFAEPGSYTVDHALIKKDGMTHLFYIRGIAATNWPEYPLFNFGHAVSRDLKNWEIQKPVLQCPVTGWDQYQVWAPYILEREGMYYMLYAGENKNVSQAICLATSTDLYDWNRYDNNPVITTGAWGIWDSSRWSDCRDPVVLQDGETYYCYYTAVRKNTENGQPESCLGISSSADLIYWKDEGFIRLEQSLVTPPESPFVLKRRDTYYLFYTNYKYGTVYLTSKNPVKGWKELPADKMVLMGGISASEIYEDNGKWYMSYISHQKNGLHFFEIKELSWNKDGSISIKKL
jgi:predicted GH43/DUF377 family glycosyl hydrolase